LRKEFNIDHLLEVLKREGFIEKKTEKLSELKFYRGKGCEKCGHSGYRGRKGIYEVLEVTNELQDLILKRAPTTQIQDKAVEQGMILMWQDGFIKCLAGVTTIDEVLRVSKE
jgi:type IV pilus assembly protein PilB